MTTTHYEIERANADTDIKTATFSRIGATEKRFFLDQNVEAGVSYLYRIIAVNDMGIRSSPSEVFVGSVTNTPPLVPSGLTAKVLPPVVAETKQVDHL